MSYFIQSIKTLAPHFYDIINLLYGGISMNVIEKTVKVKDYVTKSSLPSNDYVINPYIGCPHGCKYCYACFMKRFTNHSEEWGSFIDIKLCDSPLNTKKLIGKSVFLSSVTDCYNQFEEKYQITRNILKQLIDVDCQLGISTKSKLILRDLDLLKKCKHLQVSMSMNTLDEKFKDDMDMASSIKERLETLKSLHESGIYTILFMSPIFPEITDFKAIIEESKSFIDEFWFENLNLRGSFKTKILTYINDNYPSLKPLYHEIYIKGNKDYWKELAKEIDEYCQLNQVKYINYFYHEELVAQKKERLSKKRID